MIRGARHGRLPSVPFSRTGRAATAPVLVFAAVAVVALVACSTGASPAGGAGIPTEAPDIPTPLATTLQTAGGTWGAVPMGHLDQPLNTFWQLLYRPTGSATWSNRVEATAVATNGGLVLASPGNRSLLVGVRPSHLLTYSPLISTSDAGRSWSNGLLDPGLEARPDALAVDAGGEALALVGTKGSARVLSSAGDISAWHAVTSTRALAAGAGTRSCGLESITAVGYMTRTALVGGACSRPGADGIFALEAGSWHAVGPALPRSLGSGRVEVLGLRATGGGVSALLGVSGHDGTSLLAAWGDPQGRWRVSPPLAVTGAEHVASYGPATGDGMFVLLTGASGAGTDTLATVGGPGDAWRTLPPPPAGTATAAFGTAAAPDALAVHDTVLTVWVLSWAGRWSRAQVIHVPIELGSST